MVFEETARQLKACTNYLAMHPIVTNPEIGVMGFSMGGSWALWLADQNPLDVNTAVIYYTSQEGEFANSQAMVIGHFAENDAWVKAETIRDLEDRLTACGRPFTFYSYPGTKHWFCESNLPDAYNHNAAELAWQRSLEVLSRNLK
jgi:carboxymethylenebutenolidase